MGMSKFRQVEERDGTIVGFVSDPERKVFAAPGTAGHLEVAAVSCFVEADGQWVRGWDFSFRNKDNDLFDSRCLDADELEQIRLLMTKGSDDTVRIGFRYRSVEGVIFDKFSGGQRIAFSSARGSLARLESISVIDEVLTFLDDTSRLWEG